MGSVLQLPSDIPEAPYYVVAIDTFMSGWGEARDRTNKVVLPCESRRVAEKVLEYARSRSEMRQAKIISRKPRFTEHIAWSLLTRETAKAWFEDTNPPTSKGEHLRLREL